MNTSEVWISFDWISYVNHGFSVKLNLDNCHDLDDLKSHIMHKIHNHNLHKYGVITEGEFVEENQKLNLILKNNSQKNPLIFVKISKGESKLKLIIKNKNLFFC